MHPIRCLLLSASCFAATHAHAQTWTYAVTNSSSLTGTFNGSAAFSGTFIGNYDQATNPSGTRTLPYNIFGTRPPAPQNVTRTISGNGSATGSINGQPRGSYTLSVSGNTIFVGALTVNLIGPAAPTSFPISTTITYQSFLTAAPNNSYPFLVPITIPFGDASVTAIQVYQLTGASGTLTPAGGNNATFSVAFSAAVSAEISFQGAPSTIDQVQDITVTGTINRVTGAATLTLSTNSTQSNTTPTPLPPNQPFDLPPLTGTGDPARLLMNLTVNSQSTTLNATSTLPGTPTLFCPPDWNRDGGVDGDDVIEFFADWDVSNADYNGDLGTDGDDVIAFFADWDRGC